VLVQDRHPVAVSAADRTAAVTGSLVLVGEDSLAPAEEDSPGPAEEDTLDLVDIGRVAVLGRTDLHIERLCQLAFSNSSR
jgi:hypothetical protein